MKDVEITAVSKALPSKVVTNNDLSQIMDTSDEWIKKRTGISQRHFAEKENTSDLASRTAQKLLDQVSWKSEDLDLIVVATMSPDSLTPAVACRVQAQIGAKNAVAFDLSAASSGFSYALEVARSMMIASNFNKAMVIGAEVISKLLDFRDRSTAVLFGDGSGGVLLERSTESHFLASKLQTFGELGNRIVAGEMKVADDFQKNAHKFSSFEMDGREVYHFATHEVPATILETSKEAGIELADIDYFILHQANSRIVKQVAKKLKQPEAKFPINISQYGNTAAASEAILLSECVEDGLIKKGNIVALCGFGGGLTTAVEIIRF